LLAVRRELELPQKSKGKIVPKSREGRTITPIRILLADDHNLFVEMLTEVLRHKGERYAVIGEARNGEETLALVTQHHPDLLLLDYKMPGIDKLPSFCREVMSRSPGTRILLVSGYVGEEIALEATVGGARGYILKGASITDLLSAIATVHEGRVWVDPRLPPAVFNAFLRYRGRGTESVTQLSRQELQVLSLVAQGMANKEIATRLYISDKTVKNHLTHIFAKLKVANRRQAALSLSLWAGDQEEEEIIAK
jgi:DNA-binding NarL/FixJ family response regulator